MTGSGLRLHGNCNRIRRSCRLAVGLFQGGEQFGLDRGQGRLIGSLRAAQREAGQPRGDLEGAGCLAQGHAFHSPVTDVLEVAYHRSEEFLGGGPFLLGFETDLRRGRFDVRDGNLGLGSQRLAQFGAHSCSRYSSKRRAQSAACCLRTAASASACCCKRPELNDWMRSLQRYLLDQHLTVSGFSPS